MKLELRRVGNSLGAIVPKKDLQNWGVGEGDFLELGERGIRPVPKVGASHALLDELKRALSLAVIRRCTPRRAAGEITGKKQFIIIGSQSLHGKYPDVPDEILLSAEVGLIVKNDPKKTEALNFIGVYSRFHETHGYYADPVDEKTATLPRGWKGRMLNLPPGNTQGVSGLCLDPHDLAIAKYVARREKNIVFTHALAARGMMEKTQLLALLAKTPIDAQARQRIRLFLENDFK